MRMTSECKPNRLISFPDEWDEEQYMVYFIKLLKLESLVDFSLQEIDQ